MTFLLNQLAMKKKINNILKRAFILMIALSAFFLGYEMGFFPQIRTVPQTHAQDLYQKCYALKTTDVGYEEFNEGNLNEENSIQLPLGWGPVGLTSKPDGSLYTLVCGK